MNPAQIRENYRYIRLGSYHEAGHAVAVKALGGRVVEAVVHVSGNGHVRFDSVGLSRGGLEIVSLAGLASELLFEQPDATPEQLAELVNGSDPRWWLSSLDAAGIAGRVRVGLARDTLQLIGCRPGELRAHADDLIARLCQPGATLLPNGRRRGVIYL